MTTTVLTWAPSGNGVRAAATPQDVLSSLATLIGTKSGNAAFSWEVAGSNVASAPYWLLLRRKDGSAGRIALIAWTGAPAGNNAAILDGAPPTSGICIAYFPNGTGTTLSNLTAASGTVCGNDTGAIKIQRIDGSAQSSATVLPYYTDSYDGVYFHFNSPSSANMWTLGAGALLEDSSGNAVDATYGSNAVGWATLATTSIGTWLSSANITNASSTGCPTGYRIAGSKMLFTAFSPSGVWTQQFPSNANDMLSDQSTNRYWYAPISLMGNADGDQPTYKIRQLGYGSGSTSAIQSYYTTGPVLQAFSMNNQTIGGGNSPWFVNFKI